MSLFGICHLSLVPCRAEASDRSEQVTQLLFGETFQILEQIPGWIKINIAYDGYTCWVGSKQYLPISSDAFNKLNQNVAYSSFELVQILSSSNGSQIIPILLGSSLPNLKDKIISFDNFQYSYDGIANENVVATRKSIVETAYLYLNAPYNWGGRSPFGIDCSGFTQMVYKLNGIKLKRDAHEQAMEGESLSFLEEAEEGDLAFFDNDEGRIIHVGIVMSEHKIIHASGKVRIDRIDHEGIFNVDAQKYSHRLRILKRILN
jgi:cell wall-associated NlpC family hydrolase